MLHYTKVYPVANTPPAPRKIINKKPRPKQNPYTYPYPYTHTYTYSYNIHIYICIYIYIYTHTCTQAYTHILNKLYKSNLNPTSVTPGWPQWPTEVGHCSKGWTPKMKPKACFLLIFIAFSVMGLAPVSVQNSIKIKRRNRKYYKKQFKSKDSDFKESLMYKMYVEKKAQNRRFN